MECQDTQAPLFQPRSPGTGAPGNECLHINSSPTTWEHGAQALVVEATSGSWDGVLAHGLLSMAAKDTTQRQSQSQDLSDSGTMHFCEGAEQRGDKEISGKMIHRF